MQICAATVESSMAFPQKIKNGTALWPRDHTSGNLSKETWNTDLKEYIHPYVCCNVIYNNSQDLEATQVPISRWVDKKAVVYLHDGILVGYKKKEIPPFVTAQMDL